MNITMKIKKKQGNCLFEKLKWFKWIVAKGTKAVRNNKTHMTVCCCRME